VRTDEFGWLLNRFASETPGVRHAVTVSADGFFLASSDGVDRTTAQQFAAVVSGLTSLATNGAACFGMEPTIRLLIEAAGGLVIINRINSRAALGVIVEPGADVAAVAYEMALICDQAGAALTPDAVDAMKNVLTSQRS
jgi:uncharacterized protein